MKAWIKKHSKVLKIVVGAALLASGVPAFITAPASDAIIDAIEVSAE